MVSVPPRARTRVPVFRHIDADDQGDQPVALSLDYSVETHNPLSTPFQRRAFIREFSSLQRLRGCGTIPLPGHRNWNRCEHTLCDNCARLRASRLTAYLVEKTSKYENVIALTLSLQSTPEAALSASWDALDRARGRFVGDWLKTRVDGWKWSTEITLTSNGWHPHAAFLLFSRNVLSAEEYDTLHAEALSRWTAIVAKAGYYAAPTPQHFERITRARKKGIRYAQKGLASTSASSTTPGLLLDLAAAGDAQAAADWIEIDTAAQGRRFTGTGGTLRGRRPDS
jgi:hypothetical protein